MANVQIIETLLEDGSKVLTFSKTITETDILNGLTIHTDVDGAHIDADKDLLINLEAVRRTATVVWAWTSSPRGTLYEMGDTITGTVTVTNTGNQSITDGTLDISGTPFTIGAGTGYSGTGSSCTLDTLAPSESVTVNVSYTVPAYGGTVQSTATLTATQITQAATSDLLQIAGQPVLDAQISAVPTSVYAGQRVTLTAIAANTTDDTTARNCVFVVTLPDVFDNLSSGDVSASPSGSVAVSGTVATVTIGDLAEGEDVTVTVNGTVKTGAPLGPVNASAKLTADNCTEDEATVQITVTDSVTVNITPTNTPHASHSDRYVTGDEITYTVTISNATAGELTGLTVNALSGGDILDGKATDTITIPAGDNKVYTVTHTVTEAEAKSGTYTATVQVTGDQIDKSATHDWTVAEGVYSVSIAMARTDSNDPAKLGDVVTGTITVTNDGTYDLSDLTVTVTPADTELTVE